MLDIFALVVLLLLVGVGIWLIVFLGNLPGNIAREAGHPQTDAIVALSWIGLLTMGVAWFAALVWARTRPPASNSEIEHRLQLLEARLAQKEGVE